MVSWDETILPGKEGKVKVYIDTSEDEGEIRRTVAIETDDVEQRNLLLVVKAEVISPIEVSPKRVYLIGRKTDIIKARVMIKANLKEPLFIKPMSFDLDKRKVQYYISEIERGKKYEIKFVKFPSEDKEIAGRLKIKTSYSRMPYIEIWVKGYFR